MELKHDALLDVRAAAKMVGCDHTTIAYHCRQGRLGQRVGRDWVIRMSELQRFQREQFDN